MKQTKRHILVLDPTAFSGGSKVATANVLALLDKNRCRVTILSADKHSWNLPNVTNVVFKELDCLANKEQGINYFIRHGFIAIKVLKTALRFGKIDLAIGASGPGVDLALYMIKKLTGMKILQLIHGPVACSRTIGRCLNIADDVHFLASSKTSIINVLSTVGIKHLSTKFHIMSNGLSEHNWPSSSLKFNQKNVLIKPAKPVIFWAASLLKWKGLETLLRALQLLTDDKRPTTHICYIKPKDVQLAVSQAPVNIHNVNWYQAPHDLDTIRSKANIFVSTSENEPFGLSILEAMAAGHCVLIPDDGAYWAQELIHNINCVMYKTGDVVDLAIKIKYLSNNTEQIAIIGKRAAELALTYRAKYQYGKIKQYIENNYIENKHIGSNQQQSNELSLSHPTLNARDIHHV
jgi:glycosyltransferase involved in cell wall biosynthesis